MALLSLGFSLSTPASPDATDWYIFTNEAPTDPGAFRMNDWLDAPAGRQGRIVRQGDQLIYGSKPIRLWGLNNTFVQCAPDAKMAQKRAAFYAKYGVNTVRFHKYGQGTGWAGILNGRSYTEFDPAGLDRMDFFIAQLKERGIFSKVSQSFGPPKIYADDLDRVPFAEEFESLATANDGINVPHSAVFYSEAIQDLHIEQMVNLLNHVNPYTGLRYADDPAIWDVEIINEQSILFYTSSHGLERSPTLLRLASQAFSDWLTDRYGDQASLVKAWGEEALNMFDWVPEEDLAAGTIAPVGNPYFWNLSTLQSAEAHRRQRHLDTLEYLTSLQVAFYQRFVDAVRATGYSGEISASNWQAGSSLSHLANLWSDSLVGTIDRHNYFGGTPKNPETGKREVNNGSMLTQPGGGMLSSGMQQVAGLPFMLSEWIHVWPNEWGVEGPAIIGAYGLGLQGWDVSYLFQNFDDGQFSTKLGGHRWDVSVPQIMGLFPAVARQVLRGDVREAEQVAALHVHAPSLFKGSGFDFVDQIDQGYDDKVLQSDKVGPEALAVARVEVKFTGEPEPTPRFPIEDFREGNQVLASTGQLAWTEGQAGEKQSGFFTMDTAGTLALVGFAKGHTATGKGGSITLNSHYGAVYLTAMESTETLENGSRLLVVALARARNTGQTFNDSETVLLEVGEAPVLLEPVRATIHLNRKGPVRVQVLDHDGRIRGGDSWTAEGAIQIDTGALKTPYLILELPN